MNIIAQIKLIAKEWEVDFKADLFEGVKDSELIEDVKLLINELFAVMISDADAETGTLINSYKNRFKSVIA
jgi:hypothetical protein